MSTMLRPATLLWLTAVAGGVLACGPESSRSSQPTDDDTSLDPERSIDPSRAHAQLWPELRGTPYRETPPPQVKATRRLLAATVRHARGQTDARALGGLASEAGLRIERWRIGEHQYLAVLEQRPSQGRTGSILVRVGPPGPGPERILQAPHAFFDRGTGELGLALLLAHPKRLRAFATNTLHRNVKHDGTRRKDEDNPADVCHNDEHPFVAATMGLVDALGPVEVIQLHGFADAHPLPGRPGALAVVSAGDPEAGSPRVTEIARALEASFGGPVARYPDDVDELGGTTNVIGRRLRAVPRASFLHVELSASFRRTLRTLDDGPARLGAALLGDEPLEDDTRR